MVGPWTKGIASSYIARSISPLVQDFKFQTFLQNYISIFIISKIIQNNPLSALGLDKIWAVLGMPAGQP